MEFFRNFATFSVECETKCSTFHDLMTQFSNSSLEKREKQQRQKSVFRVFVLVLEFTSQVWTPCILLWAMSSALVSFLFYLCWVSPIFIYSLKFMYVFWERQRLGRGSGREGDRIPSRLHTISTESDVGLVFTNCEIWPELKSDAYPTEPPRHPKFKQRLGKLKCTGNNPNVHL